MNISQPKKHPQKSTKKRLTNEQVKLLETSFNYNNKLDSTRKSHLAQELGIPARQIAIWYQNKRARWRNQSLETEYKAIQHKLERVSSDKSRLEREVERLKVLVMKLEAQVCLVIMEISMFVLIIIINLITNPTVMIFLVGQCLDQFVCV
uniref:Homeobox-leucine zipper protein n=1 Tax=Helianthus annuus TaxID=4232 RepID=A0A251RT84_HELAN